MIDVRVGTINALEVREDPDGNQSVVKVEGERIVSFLMPNGVNAMDASAQVIGALNGVMMEVGAVPWWIESDDQAVLTNLLSHYNIDINQMPPAWGDGTTTDTVVPSQISQWNVAPPPDQQTEETAPPEPEPEPEAAPEPEGES